MKRGVVYLHSSKLQGSDGYLLVDGQKLSGKPVEMYKNSSKQRDYPSSHNHGSGKWPPGD